MIVVVQIGSGLARSACGTYFSTCTPCASDGRASPVASAAAPPASTSLRFIDAPSPPGDPTGLNPLHAPEQHEVRSDETGEVLAIGGGQEPLPRRDERYVLESKRL